MVFISMVRTGNTRGDKQSVLLKWAKAATSTGIDTVANDLLHLLINLIGCHGGVLKARLGNRMENLSEAISMQKQRSRVLRKTTLQMNIVSLSCVRLGSLNESYTWSFECEGSGGGLDRPEPLLVQINYVRKQHFMLWRI